MICSQKKRAFFVFSHKALVFVVGHLKPAIENDFASCLSCNAVIYKTIHKASEAGRVWGMGTGSWGGGSVGCPPSPPPPPLPASHRRKTFGNEI